MSAQILDGKKISQEILAEIKNEINSSIESGKRPPALSVVIAGSDPASGIYVNSIKKASEKLGVICRVHEYTEDPDENALFSLIKKLNNDATVDGIIVQSPLPSGIDEDRVLSKIAPDKDIDGVHPYNAGLLFIGEGRLLPCTPAGVIELLKRSGITIAGKRCVVIGRSNVVGKPAAALLLKENGTVTICHSRTLGLTQICAEADILVAAIGKMGFVKPEMVKQGAVVVDVGIHRDENGKVCGDVDPACAEKASFITPVPGGVGSMTISMLMRNCLEAYKSHYEN